MWFASKYFYFLLQMLHIYTFHPPMIARESKQETAAVAAVYTGNKILTLSDNGRWAS